MGDGANLPIGSGNVHAVQLAVGEVEEEDEGVSALDRLDQRQVLARQAHLRRVRGGRTPQDQGGCGVAVEGPRVYDGGGDGPGDGLGADSKGGCLRRARTIDKAKHSSYVELVQPKMIPAAASGSGGRGRTKGAMPIGTVIADGAVAEPMLGRSS